MRPGWEGSLGSPTRSRCPAGSPASPLVATPEPLPAPSGAGFLCAVLAGGVVGRYRIHPCPRAAAGDLKGPQVRRVGDTAPAGLPARGPWVFSADSP